MPVIEPKIVEAILRNHGIRDDWKQLPSTGIANTIFATDGVVLRIGNDHPESLCDARTESVAAPAAWKAGVKTPRMIAFDDTGRLWPRPYSLWERVQGETLGVLARPATQMKQTWRAVGRELAFLHTRVRDCHDPLGYLDAPERDLGLEARIEELQRKGLIARQKATAAALLLAELRPVLGVAKQRCFLHNDLHDMNLMCTSEDTFLALIDWGDAGWGDPSLDFAKVPIDAMEYVLQGYGKDSPALLETNVRGKMVWDKIGALLVEDIAEGLQAELSLSGFREFLDGR